MDKLRDEVKQERLKNLLKQMYQMMSSEEKESAGEEMQSEASSEAVEGSEEGGACPCGVEACPGCDQGKGEMEASAESEAEGDDDDFASFFNKKPTRSLPSKIDELVTPAKLKGAVPVASEETVVLAVPKKKNKYRK